MKDESEEELALDLSLVPVHLLTCPARAASCAATLARWDATDWGRLCGRPRVHVDEAPETPEAPWGDAQRGERIVAAFGKMLAGAVIDDQIAARLRKARAHPGGGWLRYEGRFANPLSGAQRAPWILLLEDDLDFHPRIGAAVASWTVLAGKAMATLFNPGLKPDPGSCLPASSREFAADPATFLGAQALLLRHPFATHALFNLKRVTGMQSQRLAQLHQGRLASLPILVHRPSLVQHLPVEGGSGWGARVQQALDFDPSWRPLPP